MGGLQIHEIVRTLRAVVAPDAHLVWEQDDSISDEVRSSGAKHLRRNESARVRASVLACAYVRARMRARACVRVRACVLARVCVRVMRACACVRACA
eukprot:3521556-Pleurochrysis_carterae.AAC.1